MRTRISFVALLACSMVCLPSAAWAQVHPHHAAQIRKAAKEVKPRVAPKKPRTVLIWNTPPHLMDKDPHKGYCIPYGEEAMKALGEESGAFKPVVSDDIAMLTPESIKQFDAIVLNNASGPWITPTAADMDKPASEEARGRRPRRSKRCCARASWTSSKTAAESCACISRSPPTGNGPSSRNCSARRSRGTLGPKRSASPSRSPSTRWWRRSKGRTSSSPTRSTSTGPPTTARKLRVLMSIDPARTNMGPRWIDRKQTDFALTWVKPYGKGRIFNTSFGHMASLYSTPQVLQFYLDAIQFAAGDLEAPTAPRESGPVAKQVPGTQPAPGLEPGFYSLFDGKTLDGWDGDRTIWSVQDGAITGQTKADTGLKENNFLIWKDQVENFELRLKFRLENGNSGIYYRAQKRRPGETQGDPLVGTQADFDASGRWTGVIMEYLLRDVLAERGQKVVIDEQGKKQATPLGDPAELLKAVKPRNGTTTR